MRSIFVLLFIILFSASLQAQEKYFHELRGFEDSTGTTHLFYRLFESSIEIINNRRPYENHLYHYNTVANTDSILLEEETIDPGEDLYNDFYTFRGVRSYDFLKNDLSKLVYMNLLNFEPPAEFFDVNQIYDWNSKILASGGGNFVDSSIPKSLHDRIIISVGEDVIDSFIYEVDSTGSEIYTCIETNACTQIEGLVIAQNPISGEIYNLRNDTIEVLNYDLENQNRISLHPSLENIFYDYGTIRYHNFYFDTDSLTFYSNNENTLYRYNYLNNQKTDSLGTYRSVTIDSKNSGHIYVSESTSVLYSADFGETFEILVDVERHITGLYKKPNSDSLFILTRGALLTYSHNELIESDIILLDKEVAVEIPASFTLHQNYPNPFNPSTVISYELTGDSFVTLKVFDALGREVAVLEEGIKSAGNHVATFNANNLSSGIYYYALHALDYNQRIIKKMPLIK
jgi:hypothetical protein